MDGSTKETSKMISEMDMAKCMKTKRSSITKDSGPKDKKLIKVPPFQQQKPSLKVFNCRDTKRNKSPYCKYSKVNQNLDLLVSKRILWTRWKTMLQLQQMPTCKKWRNIFRIELCFQLIRKSRDLAQVIKTSPWSTLTVN